MSLLREARARLGTAKLNIERRLHEMGLLGDAPLTFPDFLGIGAQKSGTTWLNANLRSHPDIFVAKDELHYFDQKWWTPLRRYSKVFAGRALSVSGEITPAYSILPLHRIRVIHALRPDLKLIFLMRNPIERAWSQARMNLVKLTDREYEDVSEEEFLEHFTQPRSISSIKRGDYLQILDNWLAVFPEEQLHVDFFERIADDPQGLLEDVFSFLDVSTDVDWEKFPYNEVIFSGPDREIPPHFRSFLEDLFAEDMRRLHDRFGDPVHPWLEGGSDSPS